MKPTIDIFRKVFATPWLNVFETTAIVNNKPLKWVFCTRRKEPYQIDNPPDAVLIVPFVKIGGETRLLVTREFRVPIGTYEYGFPAGLVDKDEETLACAHRELFEETGYGILKVLSVSPPNLYSSSGLTDERTQTLIAHVAPQGSPARTSSEVIEVLLLSHKKLEALLEKNPPMSAKAWPICYLYQQLGKFPDLSQSSERSP